jgi:hypothetical protein
MMGEEDISVDIMGKFLMLVVVGCFRLLEIPIRIVGGKWKMRGVYS